MLAGSGGNALHAALALCDRVDVYGVGARFDRASMPPRVFERPLRVTAAPGDLFLFNSEFFHDTPRIMGTSSRTVFNSFAGFSADGRQAVEIYA